MMHINNVKLLSRLYFKLQCLNHDFDKIEILFHLRKSVVTFAKGIKILRDNGTFLA